MNKQPTLGLDFNDPPPATMYRWQLGELHGIGTLANILDTFKPERHGGQWMVESFKGLEVLEITEAAR
ncbi:MAG: hypothetical protein KAZ26_20030 [Caldilineaceae bacterium]|nr:hypothetical protein [Caldilineaceae bacterium]